MRSPTTGRSAMVYAGIEILEQAIERAGTTDKAAVIAEIQQDSRSRPC